MFVALVSRVAIVALVSLFALVPSATLHAQRAEPAAAATEPQTADRGVPVVVASKPFGESYLLGEMFAQLLEADGYDVDRRLGLGATEIAFQALRSGAIDVYPEYTGTGLVAILNETPEGSPQQVFARVARVFDERYDTRWLAPLGFENTYAIAVRRATADSLGLRTLSDLARVAPRLVAGFTPDFIGRDDGLVGLTDEYGFAFRDVRSLLQAVKYQALAGGSVDVIDGYSTDGQLARYDLVVLEDDRAFFPPYEAAAFMNGETARTRPDVAATLGRMSGRIDVAMMQRWNERLEAGAGRADLARAALGEIGLLADHGGSADSAGDPILEAGAPERASLPAYLWERRARLLQLTLRHLLLVGVALGLAIALGVTLGLALERTPRIAEGVIRGVGLLQVIPSIALLAFMIPLLGIGVVPALVALFLYSLYPIVRNTYTGVRDADAEAVEAAEALGMTPLQRLRLVRLPLAAPTIMAGIRTAAVITVGTATLAAFIGAGGLGDPIVAGLALADTNMILSGAIPAALLALLVDALLAGVERIVRPGGLGDR